MAITISAVSFIQLQANDPVNVVFTVGGPIEPDEVVQIYASGRSDPLGTFQTQVELTQTEHEYTSEGLSLPPGTPLVFHLCPRIVKDGQAEDDIDGQPFETFCVMATFTTKGIAPPPPPPPALPAPVINQVTPRQATLTSDARIDIHWVAARSYDEYQVFYTVGEQSRSKIIESAGADGAFGVTPTQPGQTFIFTVEGHVIHSFLGIYLSEDDSLGSTLVTVVIPPNTQSLRTFLSLSNVTLNPGIRSLGVQAISRGIRAMMHL
jgi:hypothetical protein